MSQEIGEAGALALPWTDSFLQYVQAGWRVCGGSPAGNNLVDCVEGGVSAENLVRSGAVRERLIPVAAVALVSIAAAESIAGMDTRVPKPLVALLALAGGAVLLSVDSVQLFLAWLFVAPIFQESAANSHIGHALSLALYTAPPIVLLVKHLAAQGERPRAEWFDFFPALYLLYVVISLAATGATDLHTLGTVSTVRSLYQDVAIGIVIYYVVAFWRGRGPSLVAIARVLLYVAGLQAVMAIIEAPTHWNLWHDTSWQRAGDYRSIATLGNPAVTGAVIGVGIVVALAVLCWRGPFELRRLAIAMLIVGFPALYATKTRGPILATLVAALLIVLFSARSRLVGVSAIGLVALLLVVFWPRIQTSSVYQARVTQQQNIQARLVLQEVSIKLIEQKPLLGWGYDSFDRVKFDVSVPSPQLPLSQALQSTSHDTYLTILVEYGAAGFAIFVLPWIAILLRGLGRVRRPAADRWFLVAMLASVLLLAVNAATLDYRFFSFVPMLGWLSLALVRRRVAEPARI
ncbi:MAG TPA: O-antigen ligase family protein [Gaiellaceae bacterium]|nr:O-antigen ligase family protein [Gaiellaceae bacterium]